MSLINSVSSRDRLLSASVFLGYILLLVYFKVVDVYHQHFFEAGLTVVFYNFMRCCFMFYLGWFFYVVGERVLAWINGNRSLSVSTLDVKLLSFFTGVGVWHIFLLLIGFCGLYTLTFFIPLTVFLLLFSLKRLNIELQFLNLNIQNKKNVWFGMMLAIVAGAAFIVSKGLYPAGGHDYYNHYFHYYREVVETGSILPNNAWYHFYYSKGAGLFFLSMLLTDPLAPQLASTVLVFAGGATLYSIIRRASTWELLPWIGVALYFLFFIYTPGPYLNLVQGGWGDLEKPHEPAGILIFALIWMIACITKTEQKSLWGWTLILTAIGLVIISPATIPFSVGYLAMAGLMFFFLKRRIELAWVGVAATLAVITFMMILWSNYIYTGLPYDQGLFFFWPIINFSKFVKNGLVFELVMLHNAKTGMLANAVPFNLSSLPIYFSYIRLDVWFVLAIASITVFLKSYIIQGGAVLKRLEKASILAFSGFLLLVFCSSFIIAKDQPISFYRFTTFSYAPLLCLCLLLLAAVITTWKKEVVIIMVVCVYSQLNINKLEGLSQYLSFYNYEKIHSISKSVLHFISGKYSLADAYKNQQGWPGRLPWGGIYPAIETVWKQLPENTRIWSFHIHSYCMLPNCEVQHYYSNRFSYHSQEVYFGDPAKAKEILNKEGLNYFFYSNSLDIYAILPLSPLFSPNNIARYLGIAWTDGENTLLTWKEFSVLPLDKKWVESYRRRINDTPMLKSFPYDLINTTVKLVETTRAGDVPKMPW